MLYALSLRDSGLFIARAQPNKAHTNGARTPRIGFANAPLTTQNSRGSELPTEKKVKAVQDIQDWLDGATIVISTNYSGLPVSDITGLRRALREKEVRYKVVKNTLAYLAADAAGKPELKRIIQGPSAIAFGYGEPTDPAKAIADFIRENRSALQIRGALLDGDVLDGAQVQQLANLPGKDVLLAQLLGQIQAPVSGLVNVLSGPISGLARVLQGRIDNLQEQPSE